jgi:hypothetical protein
MHPRLVRRARSVLSVLGHVRRPDRSETAPDLRTLTTTGASGATRRMITAATAAALGLFGAILGMAGAVIAGMVWTHSGLTATGCCRLPADRPIFDSASIRSLTLSSKGNAASRSLVTASTRDPPMRYAREFWSTSKPSAARRTGCPVRSLRMPAPPGCRRVGEIQASRPGVGPAGWPGSCSSGAGSGSGIRPGTRVAGSQVRNAPGCSASWSAGSGRRCTRRRQRRRAGRCELVDPVRLASRCGSSFLLVFRPALRRSLFESRRKAYLAHRRKSLFCLLRYVLGGPKTGSPALSAPQPA